MQIFRRQVSSNWLFLGISIFLDAAGWDLPLSTVKFIKVWSFPRMFFFAAFRLNEWKIFSWMIYRVNFIYILQDVLFLFSDDVEPKAFRDFNNEKSWADFVFFSTWKFVRIIIRIWKFTFYRWGTEITEIPPPLHWNNANNFQVSSRKINEGSWRIRRNKRTKLVPRPWIKLRFISDEFKP